MFGEFIQRGALFAAVADEQYISLSDLQGFDDELMIDVDADANKGLPPISPGDYVARVAFSDRLKPGSEWKADEVKKTKTKYIGTMITHTILSDMDNNESSKDRMISGLLSTLVRTGDGTNRIQALAQGLGASDQFKLLAPQTAKNQAIFITELLNAMPNVGVEIDWEAYVDDSESPNGKELRVRGSKRFPKDADGNPIPEYTWKLPEGETSAPARAVVKRYFMLAPVGEETEKADSVQQHAESKAPVAARQTAQAPSPAPAPAQAQPAPVARSVTFRRVATTAK